MVTDFKYPGDELHLFQHAKNWKTYFSKQIKPYLKGNILEVGAGIGATTPLLNDGTAKLWMLLEPDMEMSELLRKKIQSNELPVNCKLQTGTINSIGTEHKFDAIIYIDVLEHIEYDKEELQAASSFLQPNGKIIILSPAYQYLYSPFDKAIGH
jgi:2-polyprenyl-3-methyl-5-hydroxy-6-metoxy-1,4-benzoquinol methylase